MTRRLLTAIAAAFVKLRIALRVLAALENT